MAKIQSGATSDLLTIDPTSKAARVTLYDSTGRELFPKQTGSYMARIETRHTSAAAAGVTTWNFRGPTTLKAYIRSIRGCVAFDGTGLAASGTMRYGLYRGTGAASPTGGAATAAIKKNTTFGASTATSIRFDVTGVGLTTASITYDTDPFYVIGMPAMQVQVAAPATSASAGGIVPFNVVFHRAGDPDSDLVIGADEHFALRLQTVSSIIGFGIYGSVEWDER